MWCRGTITELIPVQSKYQRKKPCDPIRYKVCDVALLKVFLIDFGSSVVLIFSGYVYGEKGFCLQLSFDHGYTRSLVRKKSFLIFTLVDNQIPRCLWYSLYMYSPQKKTALYLSAQACIH